MATVLVPLAQGCEELEAVTIMDLMVRAGVTVISAGLDKQPITASRGTVLIANTSIDTVNADDLDMIILPGGLPGADHLADNEVLQKLILDLNAKQKPLAAICAAPKVFAKLGLLKNKKATAFPGVLEKLDLDDCDIDHNIPVVTDGNITTSKGPGTAINFTLELISILCGVDTRNKVENQLQCC